MHVQARPAIIAPVLALLAGAPVLAQEAQAPAAGKWSDVAEFSYVATSGNSEAATLGFKNTLGRAWEKSSFELKAGAVRAETTTITRTAVGTPADFTVIEDKDAELSAESYSLAGRFARPMP